MIFTDLASRAAHIEAVFGYDTDSFIMALTRFSNIRGWPQTIYSDPGSQLVGAETEIRTMWQQMDKASLYKVSTGNGLSWIFGPADSPWNQGAVELLVKSANQCLKISMNEKRLSPSQFITACYEVANILNVRPIGTLPSEDSEINMLTPNTLLLGRAHSANPGHLDTTPSTLKSLRLVNSVVEAFWLKCTELYAPSMVAQRKWYQGDRQLQTGDVVAIADSNSLWGRYHLGKVTAVHSGKDGRIRRVEVSYRRFKTGNKLHECKGTTTTVTRSVQRLALLVPAT